MSRFLRPKADGQKPRAEKFLPQANQLPDARIAALRMLARRELSESQIRQRLTRRGYPSDDIDAAVARLKDERAIDDARVAGAIARTETAIRRRGKRRVIQQIERAGISRSSARQAVEDTFESVDQKTLLESSLARRLKPGQMIADDREFQRLFRFLLRQGFDADEVFSVLSGRRSR